MKRRRINLLSLTLKKFDFETAAKKVQYSMIGVLVFLLVALGATAVINNYLTRELEKQTKSKSPLLSYFQSNADFDKKIKYFIYKNNLLKEYMKEDADAFTHYTNVFLHIQAVTPDAKLVSFTVDNTEQTQFEINFPSYDSAQIFLDAVETPEFIKPFEYLKLGSFEVSGSDVSDFSLSLEGKLLKNLP